MDKAKEMQAKMLKSIEEITGLNPDIIVKEIRNQSLEKHGQKITYVKQKYGLSHGFANLLAHMSKGDFGKKEKTGDLIENQYEGKENLKPIYDKLCKALRSMEGVTLAPKKAYVSVRTGKQFAIIQPSTKKRLDLGLKFPKGHDVDLEDSGSFNTMVSHRIRLSSEAEVDEKVIAHLRSACELSKT